MIIDSLTKEELVLTVETQEEAVDAIGVFTKLNPSKVEDIPEYLERINLNKPTYVVPAGRSALEGNGGWIQNTVVTDYLDPYWQLLKGWTHCEPFEVDLTSCLKPIRHVDVQLSLVTDTEGYGYYTSILRVYAYMGQWLLDDEGTPMPAGKTPGRLSLSQEAEYDALKHINDQLGQTITEPEFIPIGSGDTFKKNPNYAKGDSKIAKVLNNQKVWNLIWSTWVERYANPAQIDVLSRVSKVNKDDLNGVSCSSPYILHIDNYKVSFEPEEFANLK